MRIRITSCKDSRLWYNACIGQIIQVLWVESDTYWVRATDGYSNFVWRDDAEVIQDE